MTENVQIHDMNPPFPNLLHFYYVKFNVSATQAEQFNQFKINLKKPKVTSENNISNGSLRDSSHKLSPNSTGKKQLILNLFKPSNSSLLSTI